MKAIHYIYTLLAAAMLLASCTNDDTDNDAHVIGVEYKFKF